MTAEFSLAVHALVYLMHTGRTTSSRELAENICTNSARVRKVMSKLEQAGYVEASRGQGSGYIYTASCELSLDKILEALSEDPISMNWRSGDMDNECLISSGMGAVMDEIYGQMNEECKKKLALVTIDSINRKIFGK